MFKKLKDKLAEEVKSSPQRLHQFAQAAQAAVTSASSSISDITNNDLFSIGDNDTANKNQVTQNSEGNVYPGPSHAKPEMHINMQTDYQINESQRQRRLSNSSFSSDISFRLPSYESPSMYHLQSDMEVSASEAEEKSPFGGLVNLDRVTKEQLYGAYRRTQDRCSKYKTQYSDLARHYKLLERENAKARNVLVETQDKALRRISELREQCSLEQSAKAHLEQALRIEIEEKNMKIESLTENLNLLQSNNHSDNIDIKKEVHHPPVDVESHLITFESNKENSNEALTTEVTVLNNKLEKLEQLVNKYKESLKVSKEKNSQLEVELKKKAIEVDNKNKENEDLKLSINSLKEAEQKIEQLNEIVEQLQNTNNSLEFTKNKEISILEINLKNTEDEIVKLKGKIEVLSKREEEYAISLAENKLSIHKELESKETEIKTLKDSLTSSQNEIKSLQSIISEYKKNINEQEKDYNKLKIKLNDLELCKEKVTEYQTQLEEFTEKCKSLETANNKAEEEYKCLQLQLKQESAEKLAMIDRNAYLENRNSQLLEENSKKTAKIKSLESNLDSYKNDKDAVNNESSEKADEVIKLNEQIMTWKNKCHVLESEIQDERVELGKLQREIEKLLQNYECLQTENQNINIIIEDLRSKNLVLEKKVSEVEKMKINLKNFKTKFYNLRKLLNLASEEIKTYKTVTFDGLNTFREQLIVLERLFTQENHKSLSALNNIKAKQTLLENEVQDKALLYANALEEINTLKKENEKLSNDMQQNNSDSILKLQEVETLKSQQSDTAIELNKLRNEAKVLEASYNEANHEKIVLSDKLRVLEKTNEELLKNLEDGEKVIEKVDTLKSQQSDNEAELNKLRNEAKILEASYNKANHEKIALSDKLRVLEKTNEELLKNLEDGKKVIEKVETLKSQQSNTAAELSKLRNEAKILEASYNEANHEKIVLSDKLRTLEKTNEELLKNLEDSKKVIEKVETLKSQQSDTAVELNKLRNEAKILEASYNKANHEKIALSDKLRIMEKTNEELLKNLEESEKEKITLKENNDMTIENLQEYELQLNSLTKKYDDLLRLKRDYDEKVSYIHTLEIEIDNLKKDNLRLKQSSESIANSLRDIELEMEEVKVSHSKIEQEKNHLNSIIDKLEQSSNKSLEHKEIQSDIINANEVSQSLATQTIENNVNSDKNLHEKIKSLAEKNKELSENLIAKELQFSNEITLKDNNFLKESEHLRMENKRLQSDIEGLQTYMTKVSKENGELNNKIRELIASSENILEKNNSHLKDDIDFDDDKFANVLRENSLLIEENLELKDQLKTQISNSAPSSKNIDKNVLASEEYTKLTESKKELEDRLRELEEMNFTVNNDMLKLQDSNKKLKFSNEKLERKLDEALVSLRHLHSLQENTELEYLKNILFEYLTGSGTHSLTLAKVLSAVVKFDDKQTDVVLQKEKERQGLLRQLGII